MKQKRITGYFSAFGLILLILDTKTALSGASEGITLCLQTVIPSLFPFMLLSVLLTSSIGSAKLPFERRISRMLKIPENALGLFLLGLLSGYPAGAQNVALAYERKQLSVEDASRMSILCNNAGPAFLFGMGMTIFDNIWLSCLLWGIQILSAIFLAVLTPRVQKSESNYQAAAAFPLSEAMQRSVKTMGLICGWVVLFRIVIALSHRWFLWLLPVEGQVFLCGLLELANGCCRLAKLSSTGMRLTLFAVFCGFGGLCVTLQTLAITTQCDVSAKKYLPAKLVQGSLCLLLGNAAQRMLSPATRWYPHWLVSATALGICILYVIRGKKVVAFRQNMMYNKKKSGMEGIDYAVS